LVTSTVLQKPYSLFTGLLFLAKVLIGSGVVEAACKYVIAQRLDQAGMHWREETAEAILTLRAAQLSTHPPDLKPHLAFVA
jgi:hypothetical protein